jgi:predicted NBD/HSP70 family sugar kinase
VNAEDGQLLFAYQLGWRDVPFEQRWRERFGLPVFVENDANTAAVGEYYFGVARNVKDLFYLHTNGIGLGSGIFIGGRLLRGANGFAGEIAHITLDPQGPQCSCGQRGCWETMIGPAALQRVHRSFKGLEGVKPSGKPSGNANGEADVVTFAQLAKATFAGDAAARETVAYLGRTVGLGIANLVRVLNPELVVLGGQFGILGDLLLPIVKQVVWERTFEHPLQVLRIATTAFGADAAALGAASLVLNSILRQPNLANIY